MPEGILGSLDGSDLSEQILPHAAQMATPGSTRVVFFKVLPESIGGATGVSQKPPSSMQQRAEDKLKGLASPPAAAGLRWIAPLCLGKWRRRS